MWKFDESPRVSAVSFVQFSDRTLSQEVTVVGQFPMTRQSGVELIGLWLLTIYTLWEEIEMSALPEDFVQFDHRQPGDIA
jgi:hypothetical protein